MTSEWINVTLGDVLTLQRGMDLPVQDRKHGTYPIVASTGIAGYHHEAAAKKPGVVIGRSGSIGGGQFIDRDFWPLNTTLWVKDFRGNDPRFCYYLLKSMDFKSFNTGSGVPTLNRNHLHPLAVLKPPIETQRSISKILGDIDDRITLLNETNKSYEEISQALFKSWFIDFDFVHAKSLKEPIKIMSEEVLDIFPDSFIESDLGEIPKGWRVGTLGELFSLRNERAKPSEMTRGLPYVPIETITAFSPFLSESKDGSEANSSLILFHEGDILFGAMRPYFHKVCMAPFDGVTRTTVFTLEPKDKQAAEYALFQAFQKSTIEYATQHSEGSTIPYAKWNNSLEKMPIVIPPKTVQQSYSKIMRPLIKKANKNSAHAQSLSMLRDSLLPRLISGRLRIGDKELESLRD